MNNKINYLTKSIRFFFYGVSIASFGAVAQVNEASTSAEASEEMVERIEVTTSRRVQTIQDVPAAVIAVNPDELVQRGMTSLTDVVNQAPGFNFQSMTGQQGRGSISARGVSQQDDTAVTAIYLDDVPLTSNTGFAAAGRLFFDGLLGDIARVELVKGPQGTLYGATAIAGAVRYISKEPDLYESRGRVTADISHTKEGEMNHLYRGFYSFPLIEDTLGLTVSGFKREDGGYVDQVSPATGEVIRENANEAEDYGYSADLYYHPTEDLDIRIKGMRQKSSFGLSSAVRIASLDKDEAYGEFTSDNAFGNDELIQSVISASVSYELDFAALDITSSRTKYESTTAQDVVSLYGPLLEQVEGLEPGSITSAPLTLDIESEKTVHEARLTSTGEGNFEWLAGLFYTDESTNNEQILRGMPLDILAVYAAFPSEYDEFAAFGNLTYYITPEFDITGGLRVSRTEQSLIFIQDGPLLGGASEEVLDTAKDTIQTYLFTARYRPHEDQSYYARIASGYRPASSNLAVYNPFTGEQLSQPIVEQDTLWSYEVGMKGAVMNDRLSYETALYYIDWQDFQTSVTFFGISTSGNAKSGITVKGFEGSLDYAFTPDLSLSTGVSYSNSTLNDDEPELFGLEGAAVPDVPKWTLFTNLSYHYELSNNMDGWISASAQYKDSTPSSFVDGNPENSSINVPSDDYTMVNVTSGIEWQDFQFTVYVNNLFNESAYTLYTANVVPGTDIADITAIPLQPRKVGLSVTYSF